jgi:hypothetical protein
LKVIFCLVVVELLEIFIKQIQSFFYLVVVVVELLEIFENKFEGFIIFCLVVIVIVIVVELLESKGFCFHHLSCSYPHY